MRAEEQAKEAEAMNEAEWLACTNPEQVFRAYGDTCSDRKLILFCVRCCYLNPIPDRTQKYVEKLSAKWRVAERFADEEVSGNQLRRSWSSGRTQGGGPGPG